MITVIDVMRDMGVEPVKELTWPIGQRVVTAYKNDTGSLPRKDLRQKTNDPDSVHCFAIYPDSFRPVIVSIVNMYCDRRYALAGQRYTLAQLAVLRGITVSAMQRRLERYPVLRAVYGD